MWLDSNQPAGWDDVISLSLSLADKSVAQELSELLGSLQSAEPGSEAGSQTSQSHSTAHSLPWQHEPWEAQLRAHSHTQASTSKPWWELADAPVTRSTPSPGLQQQQQQQRQQLLEVRLQLEDARRQVSQLAQQLALARGQSPCQHSEAAAQPSTCQPPEAALRWGHVEQKISQSDQQLEPQSAQQLEQSSEQQPPADVQHTESEQSSGRQPEADLQLQSSAAEQPSADNQQAPLEAMYHQDGLAVEQCAPGLSSVSSHIPGHARAPPLHVAHSQLDCTPAASLTAHQQLLTLSC